METICVRVRLKPGSTARVRAWAAELTRRRDEVLATMRDEGVSIESVFLDGDSLVYYMRARDVQEAARIARQSTHEIDAYHQQFKDETWESRDVLELLVDFEI